MLLAALFILSVSLVGIVSAAPAATPNDFKQCANDDPTAPAGQSGVGLCHWISSIVQKSNSLYTEGMGVAQRTLIGNANTGIVDTAGHVHVYTFSHQATKGGTHAYDWLESYDQAVADAAAVGMTLVLNPCLEDIGPPNTLGATCTSLRAPANAANTMVVPVPGDPFASKDGGVGSTQARINAYEALRGPRSIKIYGNAVISGAKLTLVHSPSGAGSDTGDSDIIYTLTYTSTSSTVLVEMAGHLAITCSAPGTPCLSNLVAWPNPEGASQISGGPYHFHYLDFDGTGGSQDNQINGAEIIGPPAISTQCTTVTSNLPCGNFSTGSAVTVHDTANLTGASAAGNISGTVAFQLCTTPTPNDINPIHVVCLVTNTVPLNTVLVTQGPNQTATATSSDVTMGVRGAYCFNAIFTNAGLQTSQYSNTSATNTTIGTTPGGECFILSSPTAVTVSSMSAHVLDDGAGWAILGLGALGIVTLGAVVFVVARKR
jgi:hypothetical protein